MSASTGIILNIITAMGTTTNAYGSTRGPGTVIALILSGVITLALLVPNLALWVRRLHDGNMSGWLLLILLVPLLGALALLVFAILPPNPAGQRFDRPEGAPIYPSA